MFSGGKAWFSQSVDRELCNFWVTEGGVITNHLCADYLFSNDASYPDTVRIYQSIQYVEDRATVFHSSYLSAVARSEIREMVSLGHFVLPPACLQKEIRNQIGSFIWEQGNSSVINLESEMKSAELKASRTEDERIAYCKKRKNISKQTADSRLPVLGKLSYCPLQSYPVNNMVTGYISIEALPRYSGELHDFTPGTAGYLAYHIQDEINTFSDVKNILKRK
ncbi:telomere repeats-binding bouquet formation protein 2 [Ambystoma mexicanum]|uniref:telomere repeats-binding bouquet formation protein 2 n=1 Tax=Ambystoma mexicanum TaxID=8296 RepID=UPI0037E9A364